jgi:hypothetical protein
MMARNWKFMLITLVLMAATLACSLFGKDKETPTRPPEKIQPSSAADTPPPPAIGTGPSAQSNPADSDWLKGGDAAVWPEYIPDDIPELVGNIRLVMVAPQSHVRIFYQEMTKDQIDQYLRLLEKQGFQLEYIVYVQEGFPDNSEERRKKGDYDAVDITKGDYHMNIGYGDGDISYDIYISGFEVPAESENLPPVFNAPTSDTTAPNSIWPTELVGVVPQPQGCTISGVTRIDDDRYSITCDGEGDQMRLDYIDLLLSEGFVEVTRMESQTGELLSLLLEKGNMQVSLILGMYPGIALSISRNP